MYISIRNTTILQGVFHGQDASLTYSRLFELRRRAAIESDHQPPERCIENGRKEQADRLQAEAQVVQLIQESATMPVYASEPEELYKRNGIVLTDHIFSAEELGKKPGTLFVDIGTETLGIIRSGGQFAQISEHTGLYSYDPAVISALSNAGYACNKRYTGIRHINLRDTALFNQMKMEDRLILDSSRAVTSNMEIDQLSGQYQIHFSLSDLSANEKGDVILLEVIGEEGERTIYQEVLTTDHFDADGHCEYTMTYQTNSTPQVSFAISAMEGVSVAVDDISWWRIP